ncbi:Maf family protein [Oscillospiraceae bacterium WX1]
MGLILASASPRRRELLCMLGLKDFKVIPADTQEDTGPLSPEEAVCQIALAKAEYVASCAGSDDIVLAADTLVYLDGVPLGKPRDASEAADMLNRLSGNRHTVYTGVALLQNGRRATFAEKTDVFFRALSSREIASYVATGEPLDKAGAYGAQGRGAVFIERIEGDFFTVMGLPLCRLVTALQAFGIDLAALPADGTKAGN